MPLTCYSYTADSQPAPPSAPGPVQEARMPFTCYSYPMMCFSYPDDEPRGGGDPSAAPPPSPGLRQMPYTCFRY